MPIHVDTPVRQMAQFYALRCLLGLVSAYCEYQLWVQ